MNLNIKGKGDKESRGIWGLGLTVRRCTIGEYLIREKMPHSLSHTLSWWYLPRLPCQRGLSFHSLELKTGVWVGERAHTIMGTEVVLRYEQVAENRKTEGKPQTPSVKGRRKKRSPWWRGIRNSQRARG